MNGINLAELAGLVTAIGGLLGGIFLWTSRTTDAQAKAAKEFAAAQAASHEEQVKDLRASLAGLREDFNRQLQEMKHAMTHQAQIVERQETMLSDYSRHVAKLERIMERAGLEIPEFETTTLRGGVRA